MKRIILAAMCALMLLLAPCALAQTITMEEAHLAFAYPEDTLVVSPQLALVYAPLLEDAGIDAQELSEALTAQGVLSRAYSPDFTQSLSVLVREDEEAFEIYDMASVTDDQRKSIRRRAESGALFEQTGMRLQDIEWQREGGIYWLYMHYTLTRGEKTVGRGIRYLTVANGQFVMIDWQKTKERFSNRDLNAFRAQIADLTIEKVPRPLRAVRLEAKIPTETSTASIEITGQTTGGATLVAYVPDENGALEMLSLGTAKDSGSFTLLVELPAEGVHDITLTASKEGMIDRSVSGMIAYSAKTLPISGITEQMSTTSDKTVISGKTLSGVQIQLVTPFGLTKKRSSGDGSFKFELTTNEARDYDYTIILDKEGYDQRRMRFTITRTMTDAQERSRIKSDAEGISYKNLQKDLPENAGKTLVITGPVAQVSFGGGKHYVRLYYNKDAKGRWYNPVIIVADEEMGVKEGDTLTAAVTVAGVYEEQDAMGETVMVPKLELIFVDSIQ